MSYKEKDFVRCVINPLQPNLLKNNPGLNELVPDLPDTEGMGKQRSFDAKEIELLFRYAILLYDPNSLIVKSERDLAKRKIAAADLSGLTDKGEDYVQMVLNCEHPLVVSIAVGYLQHYAKSKEWAAICAFESTFWESIKKLMEPIVAKDTKAELESVEKKAKIKVEVDGDITRLEAFYKKFYGDDDVLEVKAKKRITPETADSNETE